MAIPTGSLAIWEMRSLGHIDNGGAFNTAISGGTDYSQQASAEQVYTDLVIDAVTSTIITSAARPFASSRDEGNYINITSGTGFTIGRYVVNSVDGSGNATLDRAVGTVGSTGGNARFGGAITMQADAFWEAFPAGNAMYIKKDGVHTVASSVINNKDGSNSNPMMIYGYNTIRGDGPDSPDNRPTIALGANNFNFDNYWNFHDINYTLTTSGGVRIDEGSYLMRCKAFNSSVSTNRPAIFGSVRSRIHDCEASSTVGIGIRIGQFSVVVGCYVHDCTDGIFMSGAVCTVADCIIDTCSGEGLDTNNSSFVYNTLIYNCLEAVELASDGGVRLSNVNIVDCTTGIKSNSELLDNRFYNINFFNNTTDKSNINAIQITGETAIDPDFADAANGDFTPGSAFRDIGSDFPGVTNTGKVPMSPVQVASAGGASGNINLLAGKL